MGTKHTPGPWRLGRAGSVVADTPVPEMNGSDAVAFYGGHLIAESLTLPNAHLIAAAPDLLEALRLAEESVGDLKALEVVRAAIAKATGAA